MLKANLKKSNSNILKLQFSEDHFQMDFSWKNLSYIPVRKCALALLCESFQISNQLNQCEK